jgi:hypothetical protein
MQTTDQHITRGLTLGQGTNLSKSFCEKVIQGRVTASDIIHEVMIDGHAGVWWGISGPNGWTIEDAKTYAEEVENNPDTSIKGLLDDGANEGSDATDWIGGVMDVVLVAHRPMVQGELWDPDKHSEYHNPLMGNSAVPEGISLELIELMYNAGWGWKSLSANGMRVTATFMAGVTKTAGPGSGRIPKALRQMKVPFQLLRVPRKVVLDRPAQEDLDDTPPDIRKKVLEALAKVQRGVADFEAKVRELTGAYTIRITESWRAAFYLGVDELFHCFWIGDHNYEEAERRFASLSTTAFDEKDHPRAEDGKFRRLTGNAAYRRMLAETVGLKPDPKFKTRAGWMVSDPQNPGESRWKSDASVTEKDPKSQWGIPRAPKMYEEIPSKMIGTVRSGRTRDPEAMYRAVSEEEYQEAKNRGYFQSNGNGIIDPGEGTNAKIEDDPTSYLPHEGKGRIVKFKYDPEDGWFVGKYPDEYARTTKPIPFDRVVGDTGVIERTNHGAFTPEYQEHLVSNYSKFGPVEGDDQGSTRYEDELPDEYKPGGKYASRREATFNEGFQGETRNYDGAVGNSTHITRIERGTLPTSAVAQMTGFNGEIPGDHRNKRGDDWDKFKDNIKSNGIFSPLFIVVDYGKPPKLAEGNHRRDAAVELGLPRVPVEIKYFGKAETEHTGAVYNVEVEWGTRLNPGLQENTHQRYVTVDADSPTEAELIAAQMVEGEGKAPIAGMPAGMVTRTRIIGSRSSPGIPIVNLMLVDEGTHTWQGRVGGNPPKLYRNIGDIEELRDGYKYGSWSSNASFTISEYEGRTQFTNDRSEALDWAHPLRNARGEAIVVAIAPEGLYARFMVSSTGDSLLKHTGEETGTYWPSTGLGIGIDGNIPMGRIQEAWTKSGKHFTPDQLYDWVTKELETRDTKDNK